MFDAFDAFDAEITARAKRAAALSVQAARLTKQIQRAADDVDLHLLRQRVADAATRAQEAADVLGEMREAVAGFAVVREQAATGVAATSPGLLDEDYARAFERACAAEAVPLEGSYPDYRVFPFDVRLRLREERAIIGKRSWWALRPDVLVRAIKAERDRLMGAAFAAERFGAALVRAYDLLLPEVQQRSGPAAKQVALRDALALLQMGTFGRHNYTRDEFAFDLYRYRQTPMTAGGRRVALGDMRNAGSGFEVPNARGGRDRLTGLLVAPVEGDADDH